MINTLKGNQVKIFKIQLKKNEIITDRSQSGKIDFSETFANTKQVMPLSGEKINSVQLILDKSSVEILLNNGRFSMTNLFFPNEDYTILSIKSTPKKKLKNLNISSVSSIWK